MSGKVFEAKEHCKAAEKAMKTSVFRWKPDYDSAADEYSQAAQCYRIARDLPNSKECHLKASECFKKNNAFFHAAKSLENAMIVCKETAPPEEIYNLCVEASSLYQQHGSGDSGASVLDKGAKILEVTSPELAVKLFQQAADVSSWEDANAMEEAPLNAMAAPINAMDENSIEALNWVLRTEVTELAELVEAEFAPRAPYEPAEFAEALIAPGFPDGPADLTELAKALFALGGLNEPEELAEDLIAPGIPDGPADLTELAKALFALGGLNDPPELAEALFAPGAPNEPAELAEALFAPGAPNEPANAEVDEQETEPEAYLDEASAPTVKEENNDHEENGLCFLNIDKTESSQHQGSEYISKASRILVKLQWYDQAVDSLRREIGFHQESGNTGAIGRLTVAIVLVQLARGDAVAAEKAYKEWGSNCEVAEMQTLEQILQAYDEEDRESAKRALASPFIRNMDVEYARLAATVPLPEAMEPAPRAAVRENAAPSYVSPNAQSTTTADVSNEELEESPYEPVTYVKKSDDEDGLC